MERSAPLLPPRCDRDALAAEVFAQVVLVHVQERIDPAARGPVHDLLELVEVRLVVPANG